MGILAKIGAALAGGAVNQTAQTVLDGIDRFVETPEEKKAAALLRTKAEQDPDKFQAKINEVQAAHRSIFVAGPRPFTMWICAIGVGCKFIVFPFTIFVMSLFDMYIPMPEIDWGELMVLTMGLLGLSGMRSYEKKHGLTV